MKKIVVCRYGDGWKAYVEGQPGLWAFGPTKNAALGDLVRVHGEHLGIEIIEK